MDGMDSSWLSVAIITTEYAMHEGLKQFDRKRFKVGDCIVLIQR